VNIAKCLAIVSPYALVASVLLSGCQKADIDALKSESDSEKKEIAAVKAEVEQQKQRIAELSTQVFAMNEKLTTKASNPPVAHGPPHMSQSHVAGLQKAISLCVQAVRALAPPGATPTSDVHITFDAYYNQGTNRVVNNNNYVDQSAVYAFNKCMAEQGWPLS
jgi:hypothetical protein